MQAKDLKPAGVLAKNYGCKAILYGQPGVGKTPVLNTAPRPVMLSCEPGLKSMRGSTLPTWEAHTGGQIEEFFKWFFNSSEAKNFDTLGLDSGSQMAEIILKEEEKKHKDGRKVYGEMARICMGYFDDLFFMPDKNIVLICKQMKAEVAKQMVKDSSGAYVVEASYQAQPYFPGNDLNIKVPHRYDDILHMGFAQIPGVGRTVAIRTKNTDEILARNRTGTLAELEFPDLTAIFNKVNN